MDIAQSWGLPEGFAPVRYPVSDSVKEVVRGMLAPNEPVIVSIANEGESVSIVATPQRLLTIKSGAGAAGVTGTNVKEFLWESIANLVLQQVSLNCKYSIHYKSSGGGKVETGIRAKMGKDAKDDLMPFESAAGEEAFNAIYAVWQHKMAMMQQAEV